MNNLSRFSMSLPFREWANNGIVKKYYKEYFQRLNGGTFLEIGCGNGTGAKIIKKYFFPKKIIATDLDPFMIKVAKLNVHDPSIIFEVEDATKLKYQTDRFDGVFVFDALHHIPGPQWKDCLKEIYRVLKPGGIFFVYDVSIEYFETFIGQMARCLTIHPYDSMYRRDEFIDFLLKLNLKIFKKEFFKFFNRHFLTVVEKP